MDYGMYISASGILTSMYRQDVLSNNLANLDTTAFKPDIALTRQRAAARQEEHLESIPSNELLERLKGGILLMPNAVDQTQGNLLPTSSPYDVALRGEGFFLVRVGDGSGADALRLTRDGRFVRNSRGQLVTTEGHAVLDDSRSPITIPDGGQITIRGDGTIMQAGSSVGKMGVWRVPEGSTLSKRGNSMFAGPPEVMDSLSPGSASIEQNHLEQSAVDEVRMIMQISSASRDVEANVAMMQHADRLNDRLINTFARLT